ncbi:hypothetical protein HZS_7938, partial [Henneguya salminicola]
HILSCNKSNSILHPFYTYGLGEILQIFRRTVYVVTPQKFLAISPILIDSVAHASEIIFSNM